MPYFGPGGRGSQDAVEISSLMHWRPMVIDSTCRLTSKSTEWHRQRPWLGSVCTAFKGLILCLKSQMSSRTAIMEQTIDSPGDGKKEEAEEAGSCFGEVVISLCVLPSEI